MKGKLIVFEGSDGSGKATQVSLLKKYLESKNIPVKSFEYPTQITPYGQLIKSVLQGEFGPLENTNPKVMAALFAMDRKTQKEEVEKLLEEGSTVLMDRYVTSSMAHQAGRVEQDKREEMVDWVGNLEYEVNGLTREDLVIFLHVPFEFSQKLLDNEKKKDIAEKDVEYLKNAEEMYLWLSKKFGNWVTVECVKDDKLRTKEDIHQEIVGVLDQRLKINE